MHKSNVVAIRRGVLQGDIFSPLLFCVGLNCIFRDHDVHCEGIDVSTDQNIECRISTLKYDVALLNATTADANIRLESLSRDSLEAASTDYTSR